MRLDVGVWLPVWAKPARVYLQGLQMRELCQFAIVKHRWPFTSISAHPQAQSGFARIRIHTPTLFAFEQRQYIANVQVGSLLYDAILAHMLRFRYSDFGALQLKRDMSEYAQCASTFGLSRVNELFEQGMQLANTLIVPAASLPDVLESGLQMDRATAKKYISLREDYATARVGGRPLSVVMGDTAASPGGGGGGGKAAGVVTGAKSGAVGAAARARGWMVGGGGGGGGTPGS